MLLSGVAVWGEGMQTRSQRPTVKFDGQTGARVNITIELPGKPLYELNLKVLPDGTLQMSKDADTNQATFQRMSLFLDALPDQSAKR